MKYLLMLLLASPCLAGGPKYKHENANLDDEVRTIYHKISVKPEFVALHPFTLAEIKTLTPERVGEVYFCSNCATDALCVSTGTAIGGFSRITARTTACQ